MAAFTERFLNRSVLRTLFMSTTPHTEQVRKDSKTGEKDRQTEE